VKYGHFFRFEEDNFMRLPETKKDKQSSRKRQLGMTMGRLGDELTHDFGKSNFGDDLDRTPKRKRKGKGSSAKKGSSKKKFRRNK
jgi:hypothetical protein